MMNYTVPGGRLCGILIIILLFCEFLIIGKCNRGLMVVGSLRHLIKDREKVRILK